MTVTQTHAQFTDAVQAVGNWPEEDLERVAQCPVCTSSTRTLLHDNLTDRVFCCAPGTWTLYRCSGCGSAYLDPRPTQASIGRAYTQYFTHTGREPASVDTLSKTRWIKRALANGYRNWRFGTHLQPASALGVAFAYLIPGVRESLDADLRHMPKASPDSQLLDIGAGNGDFLALARAAGWDAHGVEPDPKAATVCRDRNLDVRIGGIEQFAEEREGFDYITISHVIEHVHDPRGLLEHAFDLLKPGGCLYVDTPNVDALGHKRYGDCYLHLDPPRHLVLFNWRSLERVVRDVGFTHIVPRPRASVYADAVARSRSIRNLGSDYRDGKIPVSDHLAARLLAVRMLFTHEDSEFVTLLAYKTTGQQ